MIFDHFYEGGIYFMLPIYTMWVLVILLAIWFLVGYSKNDRNTKKLERLNAAILFFGSFAFLFGMLGQAIGLFEALSVIEVQGAMAPQLLAGGFKVSMIAPLYGLGLFVLSAPIWFIFRNLIRK